MICSQILQALVYMHEKGIIHRDLKAANMLWKSNGQIRISDFGESIQLGPDKTYAEELLGTVSK